MEEQARLSKLTLGSKNPQWRTVVWPPMLGGKRWWHASLVIQKENGEQRLVVMGGRVNTKESTRSVLLMDLTTGKKEWVEGPSLVEERKGLAAAECNGGVYTIAGIKNKKRLASIERIDVSDLLEFRNSDAQWETLNCCLSTERVGCAAATVLDRYIVVVGGHDGSSFLSSVDIIDTLFPNQHTVVSGLEMTVPRLFTTIGIIGNRLYVVGGYDGSNSLNTVEYLEFNDQVSDDENNVASVFPRTSSWKIDKRFTLSEKRSNHALVRLDLCLIVAGGSCKNFFGNIFLSSVEVLDTKRGVVWSLPNTTSICREYPMVALPDCIAVINGDGLDTIESFPIFSPKQQLLNKYSCRVELDMVIQNYHCAVEKAKDAKTTTMEVLQKAAKANNFLPILESLQEEPKFRTEQELKSDIEKLCRNCSNRESVEKQLAIFSKIRKNEKLLTKNKEFTAGCLAAVGQESMNAAVQYEFFIKLVDIEFVNIFIKLHELGALVSDVHQMRIYYTFVNRLYRSNQISDKKRQYYINAALQNLATNLSRMSQGERQVWKIILQKCTEIGIQHIPVEQEVIYDQKSSANDESVLQIDMCHYLRAYEFRVGRLIPISSEKITEQYDQQTFAHVKPLGWSLNQFYTAFCRRANEEAAIAATCSILNACRQFATVDQDSQQDTSTAIALSQIVDFGDVTHIASVVQSTGCSKLQRAWDEGIHIVESAVALSGGNFLGKTAADQGGSKIIVSIMGNLAISFQKAVQSCLTSGLNNEEATILSLAVAAKLTQAMEQWSHPIGYEYEKPLQEQDPAVCTDRPISVKATPDDTDEKEWQFVMKANDLTFTKRRSTLEPNTAPASQAVASPPPPTTEFTVTMSSLCEVRLHRLETIVGIEPRIHFLEQKFGLTEEEVEGMTIAERLSRLEKLFI